ncbi:hypothetical protein NESM_000476200 [Novymonas esmeraldas]|uniref:Uncharacterized protein n=1 Tax=Novymonas esmeraldas TaxID=1808958 RepID=A0AAW0EPM8_9TRYP
MGLHAAAAPLQRSGASGGSRAADPADRFAAALEQFVWRVTVSSAADGPDPDAHPVFGPTRGLSTPPCVSPPRPLHVVRALGEAMRAAAPCDVGPCTDTVTEAGLYLLRLTRVLEQCVLETVEHEMRSSVDGGVAPSSREVPTSAVSCNTEAGALSSSSSTLHCRGRRYARSDTSLVQHHVAQSHDSASSSATPVSAPVDDRVARDLVRYHAELTLELQQSMLRCMCRLDADPPLVSKGEEEGENEDVVGCVLAHSRTTQLQWMFLDAVVHTVAHVQQRWRELPASPGSTEALSEVNSVLDRLAQAVQALLHSARNPQLRVFEMPGATAARRSPPPFTSWRSSSSTASAPGDDIISAPPLRATSPHATPETLTPVNECLGVVGADYCAKLTAQQLWCAQQLLAQRFPACGAVWDVLEHARFRVEATRSPTPTLPRHESVEPVGESTAILAATQVPEDRAAARRSTSPDECDPPPCVVNTQRKSERPYALLPELASPPAKLAFSDDLVGDESRTPSAAESRATVSLSRLATGSPDAASGAAPPSRPRPFARCALWDDFLASRHVSSTATQRAIQRLFSTHVVSPRAENAPPPARAQASNVPRPLSALAVNRPAAKPLASGRSRNYSSETQPSATPPAVPGQSPPPRVTRSA